MLGFDRQSVQLKVRGSVSTLIGNGVEKLA
jgi:hypothetical protein